MTEHWQDHANCAGVNVNLFFPERGAIPAQLRDLCATCDVRTQCLKHALDNNEVGIWAGTSERERTRIKAKRNRRRRTNRLSRIRATRKSTGQTLTPHRPDPATLDMNKNERAA